MSASIPKMDSYGLGKYPSATAIEYGFLAACIPVEIIVTLKGVGAELNTTLSSVSTKLARPSLQFCRVLKLPAIWHPRK
jgi:Flp pilus assembly pilin Flp